jgi:predicted CXXCH cytochrome family protein
MKNNFVILILLTSLTLCHAGNSFANSALAVDQTEQTCISCHKSAVQAWQKSDHAKSMSLPDKHSVLANFDNVDVEHYGQKAHFFINDNQYKVTISYDDNIDTYPIKYTFGHFPLQQYLVETEQGKLQVLPFAWDARAKEEGGQRWYHNYSHEEIRPEDRLHWRQPLQNWNGMCADCHSDGLKRNYDADENSFKTNFDNINVGCMSCHSDMSEHAKQDKPRNVAKDITSLEHPTGQWLRGINDKTAQWQGKKRDNSFMDNCFSCHSLRSPLTDGIEPNTPFLEQFMPQLPSAPTYYADGQIKEEVYVYGSFLQSKMFAKGVNCLDCHDKHTMKLKIAGNGLCLQCHGNEVYNVKSHHQHEESSIGAQCVNCHMPTKRYMGVDDRRDHSFKIPRPDVSAQFGTPNACTQCHEDKSNQWANDNLVKWHGKPKEILKSKHFLMSLNDGQSINLEDHLSIIADTKLDVISRASALQMLSFTTQMITIELLKPYLEHQENLLRLSAASAALLLPPGDRVQQLIPLLTDKYKAVRVAAARSLINSKILAHDQQAFNDALAELLNANAISSWRGEGRANQGALAIDSNNMPAAEKAFQGAVTVDPYFEAGFINLADIYRVQQRPEKVGKVLVKGMQNIPKSAAIKYAYGLHMVRQQNLSKAIIAFEEAMQLSPDDAQYAYTFVLALDGTGQSTQALTTLKTLILNYQDKAQLQELGLYLSQKLGNRAHYDWFMKF